MQEAKKAKRESERKKQNKSDIYFVSRLFQRQHVTLCNLDLRGLETDFELAFFLLHQ